MPLNIIYIMRHSPGRKMRCLSAVLSRRLSESSVDMPSTQWECRQPSNTSHLCTALSLLFSEDSATILAESDRKLMLFSVLCKRPATQWCPRYSPNNCTATYMSPSFYFSNNSSKTFKSQQYSLNNCAAKLSSSSIPQITLQQDIKLKIPHQKQCMGANRAERVRATLHITWPAAHKLHLIVEKIAKQSEPYYILVRCTFTSLLRQLNKRLEIWRQDQFWPHGMVHVQSCQQVDCSQDWHWHTVLSSPLSDVTSSY